MKNNKIKDLFSLTKSERIALIIIIILVATSVIIPRVVDYYNASHAEPVSSEMIDAYEKKIAEFESDTLIRNNSEKNVKKQKAKRKQKQEQGRTSAAEQPEVIPQY